MSIPAWKNKLKRLEVGERLVRRNPLYYSAVVRELSEIAAADDQTRREWTQERIAKILRAASHTPYGRSVGAPRHLAEWPLLPKESVRDRPQAFLRDASFLGSMLNAHATTGGTTGVPLKLVRSPESVVAEQACQDEGVRQLGLDPRKARMAVLRGDDIKDPSDASPPYWIHAMGGKRLIFSSNHLSEHTAAHFIEALRAFRPDLLWVYPTTLEALCLLVQKTGAKLHVPAVMSSSEVLSSDVWRFAERLLGCRVFDRYGQAERVACAHAFSVEEYRFVPGYAHVELIVDSQDESSVFYEIVGTSLWNTAMPLVRYRTGDLIRLPRSYGEREIAEIIAGRRSFEGVIGRVNDVLLDQAGSRVLTGVNQIPRGVSNLMRLQVVQETASKVMLKVLPGPGFSDADAEQLLRNARLKIPESIVVEVELVNELLKTKSGKTPFVVHGSEVKQALRTIGLRTIAA